MADHDDYDYDEGFEEATAADEVTTEPTAASSVPASPPHTTASPLTTAAPSAAPRSRIPVASPTRQPEGDSAAASTSSPRRGRDPPNPALARLGKTLDHQKATGAVLKEEAAQRRSARGGGDATDEDVLSPSTAADDSAGASANLRRELSRTQAKLRESQARVEELQALREEDAARFRKSTRSDPAKLDSQQLAVAHKKLDALRRQNEVLKSQLSSTALPDKFSALSNRIAEMDALVSSLQEENKTLVNEVRRLQRDLLAEREGASAAPQRIAALLEEVRHAREKIKVLQAKSDTDDRRARKVQEQLVGMEERHRRNTALLAEYAKRGHGGSAPPDTASQQQYDVSSLSPPASQTAAPAPARTTVISRPKPKSAAARSVIDDPSAENESAAREKAAEARLAAGMGHGAASARGANTAAVGRKPAAPKQPAQLSKLDSSASSSIKKDTKTRGTTGQTKAAAASKTAKPAAAASAAAAAPVASPPAAASSASAPFDVDSFLGLKPTSASTAVAAPLSSTVAASSDLGSGGFFVTDMDTAASSHTAAAADDPVADVSVDDSVDPYATKPKHRSDGTGSEEHTDNSDAGGNHTAQAAAGAEDETYYGDDFDVADTSVHN